MTPRSVGIDEFVLIIERSKQSVVDEVNKFIVLFIMTCVEEIVVGGEFGPGTPVDTGFLRAMWWLDVNGGGTPPDIPRPVRNGNSTRPLVTADTDPAAEVLGIVMGDVVALNNSAEYAAYVEHGTEFTDPRAMVHSVFNAANAIAEKCARELGWTDQSLVRVRRV